MSDDVFPDRSMEHRDKIAWMIETHGWAIEPVDARANADPPQPPYSYSIGFTSSYDFPDVVIFGLTPVAAQGLLALIVEVLESGVVPPIGEPFQGLLDGSQRCALLAVDPTEHRWRFGAALDWYGTDDVSMVQLAWPDRHGFLPWEPGFERRVTLAQPVIGSIPGT